MSWSRSAESRENIPRSMRGKVVSVLLLMLALLPVLVLGLYISLPFILERFLVSYMQDQGIQEPQIRVDSVGPRGIHLSDIRGENLGLEVDRVAVRLGWSSLMQGRADRIVVTGLNWRAGYTPEGLDLGLPFKGDDRERELAVPALPFDVLELQSSSFLMEYAGLGWRVPLSGVVQAGDVKNIRAEFETRLLGSALQIKGLADLESGRADVSIQSSWPEDERFGPLPRQGLPLQAELSLTWAGGLDDPGDGCIDFYAELGRQHLTLAGTKFGLDRAALNLQGTFDGFSRDSLQAGVQLEGLKLGDFQFAGIDMLLKDRGVSSMQARLEKPDRLDLDLTGTHEDIFALWSGDEPWSGEWDLDLAGSVSPELAGVFLPKDALVQRDFPLQAAGRLKAWAIRDEGGLDWRVSLDSASAEAGPLDLHLPQQKAQVRGIFLELFPGISAGPDLTTVRLGRESRLGFDSMSMDLEDEHLEIPGITLSGRDDWAGLDLAAGEAPRIMLDASLPGGLVVKSRDARASFAAGGLQADLEFMDGLPRGGLTVSLSGGGVELQDMGLELAGISFGLPVSWDSQAQDRGRWNIEHIYYNGEKFPGPEGGVAVSDYRFQAYGAWEAFPGIKADLGLDLFFGDQGLKGRATAGTDWFDVPSREQLQDFFPRIRDFDIQGRARLDIQADLDAGGMEPYLQLELEDLDVQGREAGIAARGISGLVALDSIDPLYTARDRDSYLHVQELDTDIFSARDGLTSFRVRGDTLHLDKSSWLLVPQGRIAVHSSRWDLEAGEGRLDMYFEDVDLLEYAGRAFQDKIEGSGLFYGHVHLGLDSDRISLGDGYIYSLPGTGRLGIKDEELMDTLLMYVRQSLAGQEYLSILSERLEEALRDFEYDYFTLNIIPMADDVRARIEIRGEGVHGDPPQRVGSLVLNVSGLEDTLNHALDLGITGEDAARRALDDWLDF